MIAILHAAFFCKLVQGCRAHIETNQCNLKSWWNWFYVFTDMWNLEMAVYASLLLTIKHLYAHPALRAKCHSCGIYNFVVNTLRPVQNFGHFYTRYFQKAFSSMKIFVYRLKCISKCPIDDKPALVQTMIWHWTAERPLSKPMIA